MGELTQVLDANTFRPNLLSRRESLRGFPFEGGTEWCCEDDFDFRVEKWLPSVLAFATALCLPRFTASSANRGPYNSAFMTRTAAVSDM